VLHNPSSALAKPRFLVAFAPVDGARSGGSGRLALLRDLTPREREIALLVCEGCANAEIARELGRSVLTVKTQLNSAFRKLGVRSRARLMALLR
jgi:DNA-binding CsgD family transcriptional regulator